MSAIYGILGDADLSELSAMGDRLAHRGSGVAEWSVASGVLFGQRYRNAPGQSLPASGPVAFDGFIDNREALATAYRFMSHQVCDDPTLVAALFERDGADSLAVLRGQFGVAHYDKGARTLSLGRDRWGSRSVYYAHHAGCLIFASEYKALLAFRDLPARPNLEVIQYIQCTMHGHPHGCYLAGVEVVPSGSVVTLQGAQGRSRRYWDVAIRIAKRSEAEHAAAVRTDFLEALKEQTANKTTIGVALSGGLDSALVVAGMHHVANGKPIHTFTAGFASDEDPEMIGAAQVAKHFGTLHHEILMPPESLPNVLQPLVWHMEDTVGHEETAYLYVTAREAIKFVDTMFSGRKADMLYAGMPRHKLIKLAIDLPPFRPVLREFYNFTQSGRPPASMLGRMLVAAYYRGQTMPPAHVIGVADFPPPDPLPLSIDQPLNQKLRRDVFDEPVTMTATERLHSAFALHSNSPFMDFRMIDRAFEIPDRLKIQGLRQKHILRVACRGLLPEGVLARKKSLQRLKHDEILSDALEGVARDLLSPQAVAARGFFAPAHVARVLHRRPGAAYSSMQIYRVWSLLLAEIWARLFLDRRGAPLEA